MGVLYITGALLYAMRIPERFFPGKVDIWVSINFNTQIPDHFLNVLNVFLQFHSHQIFHCFVIAGAIVHYHGISIMAIYRLQVGECPLEPYDQECLLFHTNQEL